MEADERVSGQNRWWLAVLKVYAPQRYGRSEDAGFFMQSLSEMLDAFIGDYLRVNAEWCD